MKLNHLACALVAALAYGQPIEEPTGLAELEPQLATREPVQLAKRATADFIVYRSNDCGGGGTIISPSGNGAKGNFDGAQHSIRIPKLTNGYHLTLYTGSSQSGVRTRFTTTEVGGDNCYFGSWLSYGLYNQ